MERSFEMDSDEWRIDARDSLLEQARALVSVADSLDDSFHEVAHRIVSARSYGRAAIFSGAGKSGVVGRYLASCLNAIGVPSIFLSPSEAIHGDLGILRSCGVLIALSVSGETQELKPTIASAFQSGIRVYLLTASHEECSLGTNTTDFLFLPLLPEIDPSGMLPLKASLMQMALGNALVVTVAKMIGFDREQLARTHPGGAIGETLKESAG